MLHQLKERLQNKLNQLPFSHLLTMTFGLMLVLTVVSTSILLITRGNRVTDSVIAKLAYHTSYEVAQEVTRFLEAPQVINQTTINAIQAERVNPENIDSISRFLSESARRSVDFLFSSIYYATVDGTFVSVGVADTHHPDEERVFSYADQSDGGRYGDYRVADDGTMGELFEYHGEYDPRVRPWYKAAISSPDPAIWSDIYSDFDTGFATLTHAMTVHNDTGALLGVAAVDLFLEHMQDYLETLDITEHSEVFIFSENGELICAYAPAISTHEPHHNIAASDSPYPFTRASAAYFQELVKSGLDTSAGFGANATLDDVDGYLLFAPVGKEQGVEWTMGVFIPRNDFLGGVSDQMKSQLVLVFLLLLLSMITIWGFIAVIVEPIKRLEAKAGQIAAGSFDVSVDIDSKNEVGALAKSIDAMQSRLKTSFMNLEISNNSLIDEKARVMTMLGSIEDGVIALDSNNRITFMNASAERQTGWIMSTALGSSLTEMAALQTSSADEAKTHQVLLQTIAQSHSQSDQSMQTLSPLLDDNPLSCRLSLITDEQGHNSGTVLVFNSMTEMLRLKLRHEEVQAAESKLSRIVEDSLNEIYMFDADSLHTIMTNRAARDNLGFSMDELLGLTAFDIVKNLRHEQVEEIVSPLLNEDRNVQYFETIHIRKDGTSYPTETRLQYMHDESPPVLVAIVHDVTNRRQQLADVLLRDRAIAEVGVGVLICDAQVSDYPIVYANPAIEQITGYQKDELLGKNPHLLLVDNQDKTTRKTIESELQGNRSVHMTLQSLRKDGAEFTNEIFVFPVHDDAGATTHFIGIINDITERLKTEVQLQHAQKIDAIGKLSGGIAHDFNNMLSIIGGRLEILELGIEDESLKQHIREAVRAVDMGADLTRRLLSFARKGSLEPRPVNMNNCVANSVLLLKPILSDAIVLRQQLEEQVWTVRSDPSEIENTLVNLAINARDAMPNGGEICIRTVNETIDADQLLGDTVLLAGDYVKLSVMDTGTGIDEATQARLFEPFFTTKLSGQGNGLGLASIFGFTKQSGGTIAVESTQGVGSSFHVYLPRYEGDQMPEDSNHASQPNSSDMTSKEIGEKATSSRSDKRVLVVEDNQQVSAIVVARLLQLGYDVEQSENGPAALELIESGTKYDLVFCDVSLPGGLSGYDVAEWIETNRPDCKIILTSGFNEHSIADNGQTISSRPLIKKPYRFEELQKAIETLLETD